VIEESIDLAHYLGTGGPLLPSIEGDRHDEGLTNPALESNMGSDLIVSDQRHILQQKPDQPLAFAIWGIRILPYPRKILRQGCDTGTLLLANRNPVTLATFLILLLGILQRPELVVPIGLQRISDEPVCRVNVQIPSLS